jgi:hypothetical protein
MSSAFRAAVEAGDPDAVERLLHPDVVFRSPAVYKPYEGREATMTVLREVFQVFEDFRYLDEIDGGGASHALIFAARVGDKEVQGLDLLVTDEDGLIREFTVMVRPMSGLIALAQTMAARLAPAR